MIIKTLSMGDKELFGALFLADAAKVAILALSILIVAIPEGLPLCVSIAMALSVNTLKKENILIKNFQSVETMAMVHDICVGKTGTLTEGEMTVRKYQLCDQTITYDIDQERSNKRFEDQISE
jgi:P-type E1-E2 ATPase